MPEQKVWTAPKKAGMRVTKTTTAGVIAVAIVEIAKVFVPALQNPKLEAGAIVVLTGAITGIWTWIKNRKKKEEVKK
jgi:uncharacterized membrane-anchored protein